MRDALADFIVDGNKRSVGLKGNLNGLRNKLGIREYRADQIRRQVAERVNVLLGAY